MTLARAGGSLILGLLAVARIAPASALDYDVLRKGYGIQNSVQLGLEDDSNIFKSFGAARSDQLIRVLAKSRGDVSLSERASIGWRYQGGGKKFFRSDEQDLLIQYISVPLLVEINPRLRLTLEPDFKYQDERDSLDSATPPKDVNEDYWSTNPRLSISIALPQRWQISPSGEFTYFRFRPQENFSFFRERGAISARKGWTDHFFTSAEYAYSRQQFQDSPREDREHSTSAAFQYSGIPFASVRYTYQSGSSSDANYSYSNHRMTFLFSAPLWKRELSSTAFDEEATASLVSLHILGTLQIKRFPEVFDYTSEGQRFLLTDSEDDNFNSISVKTTFHPWARWAFEFKYTRYSNELSSQQDSFRRSLIYGGTRLSF